MKTILSVILILLPICAFAWDNPNKAPAPQISLIRGHVTSTCPLIKLENRRVQNINGDTFTYNTGSKILTIKADSTNSRLFLKEVQAGRTSAHAKVNLIPQRQSPFNTEFKAR
jgi:hypothetical protein